MNVKRSEEVGSKGGGSASQPVNDSIFLCSLLLEQGDALCLLLELVLLCLDLGLEDGLLQSEVLTDRLHRLVHFLEV